MLLTRPVKNINSFDTRDSRAHIQGMRGILNIIIGIVFIVGGMSGTLVMKGTQSGGALAVLGVFLVIFGIYRMMKTE